MRTSTIEVLVYRLVYRTLRQKISCVKVAISQSPLVGLTELSPLPHSILF